MGIFDRIFGSNPVSELDKAESLLMQGEDEKALKITRRVAAANPELKRAQSLLERISRQMVGQYLNKADKAESTGSLSNAVEWLNVARQYAVDPAEIAKLDQRRELLLGLILEENEAEMKPARVITRKAEQPREELVEEPQGLDPEIHYQTLIGMLDPAIASHYENQSESFVNAYLALNEHRVDEAIVALDQLLEQDGQNPIYQLERGRCALIQDDNETARDFLNRAWSRLGDGDLDLAGTLSVPALWAESALRLNHYQVVLDRLEELAHPAQGREYICLHYCQALKAAGRLEDAVQYLGQANLKFPGRAWFILPLSEALEELGDWQQAIQRLEKFVAPSCVSGNCSVPKHLPSIRRLARLYLDHRVQPQRAKELLNHVAHALQGELTREDYLLLAAYHRITGNMEASAQAEAHANELEEQNPAVMGNGIPIMDQGEKAVL